MTRGPVHYRRIRRACPACGHGMHAVADGVRASWVHDGPAQGCAVRTLPLSRRRLGDLLAADRGGRGPASGPALPYACPACGARFAVRSRAGGRPGWCPFCGARMPGGARGRS